MSKIVRIEPTENHLTGFVRMYRSVANKGWYKKSEYVHLWVHLLTKATREPYEAMFDGKNVVLKPGQFITGRKALEIETGINESKIERILTFFSKNEQQIEQQKSTKNRIISIKNWHLYQYVEKGEQQSEQQLNNKRTTSEQQLNTNNKLDNIDKIDNKDKSSSSEVKTSDGIYQPCMDLYDTFIVSQTGVGAKINASSGAALKRIIAYLKKQVKTKDETQNIPEALQFIFEHHHLWEKFHQQQLKLEQIDSNLINIINSIKNGKQQPTSSQQQQYRSKYAS